MPLYVIEFRSGTFFQNLEADNGGPRNTAQCFTSVKEADSFMRRHEWILMNGGMVLPQDPKDKLPEKPKPKAPTAWDVILDKGNKSPF